MRCPSRQNISFEVPSLEVVTVKNDLSVFSCRVSLSAGLAAGSLAIRSCSAGAESGSAGGRLVISTSSPGANVADYRKDADRCYDLAKQMAKPEDLHAFLEMAQTWEKLANLNELSQRLTSSGVLFKKPAVRAE